jgi:hypothetical protein
MLMIGLVWKFFTALFTLPPACLSRTSDLFSTGTPCTLGVHWASYDFCLNHTISRAVNIQLYACSATFGTQQRRYGRKHLWTYSTRYVVRRILGPARRSVRAVLTRAPEDPPGCAAGALGQASVHVRFAFLGRVGKDESGSNRTSIRLTVLVRASPRF